MRTSVSSSRAVALTCAFLVVAVMLPATASAITRPTIISRGLVWTSKHVPYSQSRYCTVGGSMVPTSTVSPSSKGYRTDCSGFASMCLALKTSTGKPLSLDTATLPGKLVKIPKSQLTPGDVILRPKNLKINGVQVAYGHAVIFGGWTDSSKTAYWALHQSGSQKGAIRQKVTYGTSGFWNEKGFAPYRYPGARNRVRASGIFLP